MLTKTQIVTLVTSILLVCSNLTWAGDGSSCEEAVVVSSGVTQISYPKGTYWFTAGTWDLPIEAYFIPNYQGMGAPLPEIWVDFKCGGQYDPDLDSLFKAHGSISLPVQLQCDPATVGTKNAFRVSVPKSYRDQLAAAGITRNVQAYVKAIVKDTSEVILIPDTISGDCMDKSHHVEIPDTLQVSYNDQNTPYVVPFTDWTNDSIRFTWTGAAPAEIWLAKEHCTFTPTTQDQYVLAHYTILAGGYYTFSKDAINQFITDHQCGGMYYMKVISYSTGQLMVDKAPEVKPEGIELKYDIASPVQTSNQLYYFNKKWTATRFVVPTTESCRIYLDTGMQIDPNLRSSYIRYYDLDYDTVSKQRFLELSDCEIALLAKQQSEQVNYLFCKIVTNASTTITPTEWQIDDCLKKSIQMRSGDTISLSSNDGIGTVMLRMQFSEWKNYNIIVTRKGGNTKKLDVGMTEECSLTRVTGQTCVLFRSIATNSTQTSIPQAEVAACAEPTDGWYHWFFNNNRVADKVCFTAKSPQPKEYTITTAVAGEKGGTVSGGGKYTEGTTTTLTATPEEGCYTFLQWQDGNTENPRTITVTENKTYTASFKPVEFTIKAKIKEGAGSVIVKRKTEE